MELTVTDSASEKLMGIVSQRPDSGLGVRIFAQEGGGGGCACSSGMRFGMAFDSAQQGDAHVTVGSLEFLVDPLSARALEGASIDWVDNVMNSGFAITAPNARKSAGGGGCGCGANEAQAAAAAAARSAHGGCGCGGGGCGCGGH